MNVRSLTILGSTGSIGTQTLDIIRQFRDDFSINFLTANTRIKELEEQTREFSPKGVAISDEASWKEFKQHTTFKGEILCGEEGVIAAACHADNHIVMQALVGFSGVLPTLAAIEQGATIALANKETLVSAGSIVMNSAREKDVSILAVDSEHSAILQCMAGEERSMIDKIILTASGGPFRELDSESFETITREQALKHPNWVMGQKITIDSATLMNKGFEVIEAHWLFDLAPEKIDVVIHPQSIIHSLVQFGDASVKAQLGTPDMRVPIIYALFHPERRHADLPKLDLLTAGNLSFFKPDTGRFPCLRLAYEAMSRGGTAPAILNAANEIAVQAFLENKARFLQIPQIIEATLQSMNIVDNPDIAHINAADKEARNIARALLQ
ncbi:MAG: 1-deoxy-D-xylulose-5-phosphate reductoisomerase [Ignavibacteria bacterium]|jgi:1-deoxy-D-xylulose-5-phosphate reductoisomerase|nr:1-deoxy-D-xylulose 5-phosphate reductoisomerase [Chlorobiota bacterium]